MTSTINEHRGLYVGEPAIVLGNGASRELINVDALPPTAAVIGCNAIVRDYATIDYVVAVDPGPPKMCWTEYGTEHSVFVMSHPKADTSLTTPDGQPFVFWQPFGKHVAMLSGIFGVLLAMHLGCTRIYLAGFDQDGSCLYEGTPGYKRRSIDPSTKQPEIMRNLVTAFAVWADHPRPTIIQIDPNHTIGWTEHQSPPEAWLS